MNYITEETQKKLNLLLKQTFQGNSFSDNIAYNLDIKNFTQVEPIFHEKFAHAWTEWADEITTMMTKLGIRPIRLGLEENSKEYLNIKEMFLEVKVFFENYRLLILDLISYASYNEDYEVSVSLENFWDNKLIYLKQVNIWADKAILFENSQDKFNSYFEKFLII
jgi:hypothetical protein